ncbi:hypothetical protein [Micromonospora sp. WMMD812]|uniref:hypothetical protein n=1 Tax=Micromonospora sp. WMMD812 TaxID=3015152 RepID=UPI00248C5DF7|nr:hypothetical protein [Micromonospora sp. WMMD812]WBB68243.1 hypothetical protein O7603_02370 [Micromonospora sp. WMMD812]
MATELRPDPVRPHGVWAACCLLRAQGRLHHDLDALTEAVDGWHRLGARYERACTLLLIPDRVAEGHAEVRALRVGASAPADT